MKSFTVTFHHTTNYGATLQAYSLQRYLKSIGIENEIMEYTDYDQLYSKVQFRSPKGFAVAVVANILTFLHKHEVLETKAAFREFHRTYMKFSERVYDSTEDIQIHPPKADILITGSDQVWNLKTTPKLVGARFLDFGDKDTIRFSYAASVGQLNYSDEEKETVRKRLSSFKGISLREKGATKYYNSFCGKQCVNVLDPVFLTSKEEWEQIAEATDIKEKYILCYFVQGNPRIQEVINTVKKETGYKVVAINCTAVAHCKADEQLYNVSPQEFLGLYAHAELIITTSFHGAAFGLVFEKPTYALIRNYRETRISDLFTDAGLDDYLIDVEKTILPVKRYNMEYRRIIKDKIQLSKQYIKDMVSH